MCYKRSLEISQNCSLILLPILRDKLHLYSITLDVNHAQLTLFQKGDSRRLWFSIHYITLPLLRGACTKEKVREQNCFLGRNGHKSSEIGRCRRRGKRRKSLGQNTLLRHPFYHDTALCRLCETTCNLGRNSGI